MVTTQVAELAYFHSRDITYADVLTCTDCAQTGPLAQFVHIRQSREAYYGRCRICRARRARERHYSTPDIRAAEIARAWKNKQDIRSRRRLQAAAAVDG
jgi:hypothetical protein